jgi:hypothetical protein
VARSREGEEMSERVCVPLHILDELWPLPVLTLHQPGKQVYIDHLDRYVDMGVLVRSGDGYEWAIPAFGVAPEIEAGETLSRLIAHTDGLRARFPELYARRDER